MKNQVKRWTAFALVMAMIFSIVTPVFAGGPYTVTVKGPESLDGRTVYAYQLIKEDGTLTTLGTDFFTAERLANYNVSEVSKIGELSAAKLQLLTDELKAFIEEKAATYSTDIKASSQFELQSTGEASTTLSLGNGYYAFYVPDDDNDENALDIDVILSTVDDDMIIGMKADEPPIDKTVQDGDDYVDSKETIVGTIETFKLETIVPYVDEAKLESTTNEDGEVEGPLFSFSFVDELTKGLALVDVKGTQLKGDNGELITTTLLQSADLKVWMDGVQLGTDQYEIVADENNAKQFRVKITDVKSVFQNDNVGKVLKVVYRAVVTEEAVTDTPAGVVGINNAYLEYEHNGDIVTTSRDTVTLIDITITIDKWTTTGTINGEAVSAATDRGNGQYSLAGAVFKLYRYAVVEVEGESGTTTQTQKQWYSYDATTKKVTWTPTESEATELVTGTDGQVKILGLETPDETDPATYYLEETQAPTKDYVRYATPIKLVLTNKGVGSDARTPQLELTVDSQMTSSWTVSVQNEPEGWLPSTGSIGTYLFIAAGVALIIGATLLKKRPNSAK